MTKRQKYPGANGWIYRREPETSRPSPAALQLSGCFHLIKGLADGAKARRYNPILHYFPLPPKSLSVKYGNVFSDHHTLRMAHQVSLRMLSQHLGLTDGTVSRALNDYPDIAEKTRARVKAAAQELGYQPNPIARRLATGAAECVAYVLPARSNHASDPFLAELLSGLSTALVDRGWDLYITAAESLDDEIEQLKRLAATQRASGFVISRTLVDDPRVSALKKLGVPFITHGRTQDSDDHSWFDLDSRDAFRTAYLHLATLGHRDIAYIGGPDKYNFSHQTAQPLGR